MTKQNATSLLTPVSDIVFYALSSGTLGFALHGSSVNHHFLIGGNYSTANQILSSKWLLKLPWRAKPRVPLERALKTISETGVKSDVAFFLGPSIEKTNSAGSSGETCCTQADLSILRYHCHIIHFEVPI